jgi:biotin/methionine sulfoxide reductase
MRTHLTHWGAFQAESDGKSLHSVKPWADDPDPRDILDNVASARHHATRVLRPAVRSVGWSTDQVADLAGAPNLCRGVLGTGVRVGERRTRAGVFVKGPSAIYGCSYGWASAGRFHHAQSQICRFLNSLGGYVAGARDYSYGASGVLLPHIDGATPDEIMARATSWKVISENTDLFIAFGGLSEKNSGLGPGGIDRHVAWDAIRKAVARGCRFIDVAPIADDTYREAKGRMDRSAAGQ